MCRNTRDPWRIVSQHRLRPRWPLKNCWSGPFLRVAADRTNYHSDHLHYYFLSFPQNKSHTPYLTSYLARRVGRMSLGHHNLAYDQRWEASGPKISVLLWFTTVPSFENNNKVTLVFNVAVVQVLKTFKGKEHFTGRTEMFIGCSGQFPASEEKPVSQHSL